MNPKLKMASTVGTIPKLDDELQSKIDRLNRRTFKDFCRVLDEWRVKIVTKSIESERDAFSGRLSV